MSHTYTAPLVGAHFRPPAKTIIQSLPSSYPLELRPEPSNPYDANAIAVWFDAAHLPQSAKEELEATLPGSGGNLEDLLEQRYWHIGYIAREIAALHHAAIALRLEGHNVESSVSNEGFLWTGYPCALSFTGSGAPAVTFYI